MDSTAFSYALASALSASSASSASSAYAAYAATAGLLVLTVVAAVSTSQLPWSRLSVLLAASALWSAGVWTIKQDGDGFVVLGGGMLCSGLLVSRL